MLLKNANTTLTFLFSHFICSFVGYRFVLPGSNYAHSLWRKVASGYLHNRLWRQRCNGFELLTEIVFGNTEHQHIAIVVRYREGRVKGGHQLRKGILPQSR